jgi:hypothetical protein
LLPANRQSITGIKSTSETWECLQRGHSRGDPVQTDEVVREIRRLRRSGDELPVDHRPINKSNDQRINDNVTERGEGAGQGLFGANIQTDERIFIWIHNKVPKHEPFIDIV